MLGQLLTDRIRDVPSLIQTELKTSIGIPNEHPIRVDGQPLKQYLASRRSRRTGSASPDLSSDNPFSPYEEQLDILVTRAEANKILLSNLRHFRREYVRKESPRAHNPQKPRYKTEEEFLRRVKLLISVGEEARYVVRSARSMRRHCERVEEHRSSQAFLEAYNR